MPIKSTTTTDGREKGKKKKNLKMWRKLLFPFFCSPKTAKFLEIRIEGDLKEVN